MSRQNIRQLVIILSFLLFPITIYYFSPYLIIQGALEGIVVGSCIVFISMFVASLFFGRAFCGWLCPAGGVQECLKAVSSKNAKGGRLNWIKYFIWTPWVISIILIFIKVGGVKEISFFHQTQYGVSVSTIQSIVIYYGVLTLIVATALLTGKRGFCHYLCWMAPFMIIGTKIREKVKFPALHLEAEGNKCISCKKCSIKCPMSLNVNEMALKKNMKNSECILCGECVDVCPKNVIKYKIKEDKDSKKITNQISEKV